jgi:Uma2 family endonuclease
MVSTASRIKTYEDFLKTPDDSYGYELYDGEIHLSPTPALRHQLIARELNYVIDHYVRTKNLGRFFGMPLSVRIDRDVVLEPDLQFIRFGTPADNLETTWIEGAPTLAIEILSRSTAQHDLRRKRELYEQYGVEEYWIVNLTKQTITALHLVDGRYQPIAQTNDQFSSQAIPGLVINIAELFAGIF